MNQRGQYGGARGNDRYRGRYSAPRATVGAQPFRPEDADAAFRQIDGEMDVIVDATYRAMGVDPASIRKPVVADAAWSDRVRGAAAKAKQSPLWAYWESSVSPKYDDWQAHGKTSITSWEDYDRWLSRVMGLRAEAKAKGIKIETPELRSLSAPSGGGESGGGMKWGTIGVIAVGGVVAVAALVASTSRYTQ